MTDYTPTTDEIRERWMNFDGGPDATDAAEFDRWLDAQLARAFAPAYNLGYRDGRRDEAHVRVEAYKERLIETATDSVQDMLDRIAAGSDHGARDIVEAVLEHALSAHNRAESTLVASRIAKIYRDADELSAKLERDALLRPEFWAPRKGA